MRRALVLLLPGALALAISPGCGSDDPAPPPPKLSAELQRDPQQCKTCHPDQFREWSGSMHAFAGVDPVFRALNKRMQRETNGQLGNFCVQCHAPVAVREGLTTDGLNLDQLEPAKLGVTCFYCHQSEFRNGDLHNNPLTIIGDGTMRGAIKDPVANTAHVASYAPQTDHADDHSAIFCGSCHDIVTPPGAHIERTFEEWRASHVAVEDRKNCGACHMPERTGLAAQAPHVRVRQVHDHSLPGVDLAVTPFPEMDAQRAGVQKLLDDAISATLCVTADAASEGVKVNVTLKSEKVGHSFPSGAAQDRRAWVELEGLRGGASIFASGKIADGASVSAAVAADPQLFVLHDKHFDAADKETPFFWQTARVESHLLPVARSSRSDPSESTVSASYTFPKTGGMPDAVTLKVHIRPMDVDLIDTLVASGDLDPAIRATIPTLTLASTNLQWTPASAKGTANGTDCVATPYGP